VMKCSIALGNLAFMVDGRGRAVTLSNLEVALGDNYDPTELERLARLSYQNLARTFLDLLWSPNITPENVYDLVDIAPNPELEALRAAGVPVIIAGPHFGHWEYANILFGYAGFEFMIIATDIKSHEVDMVVNSFRERSGQQVIRKAGAVLRMIRRLKAGKTVAFLVDQSLRPEQPSMVVKFFGLPVCVSTIHAELANRTGAPIVHIWCYPKPDGRYTLVTGKPIYCTPEYDIEATVQETMKAFEASIRERPELFLWNYKHWRFKPIHTAIKFPFYANVSSNFDKKVAAKFAERVAEAEAAEEAAAEKSRALVGAAP
jgi:Kdo2-lipid IVA lauroyltransferase/acyltransferase